MKVKCVKSDAKCIEIKCCHALEHDKYKEAGIECGSGRCVAKAEIWLKENGLTLNRQIENDYIRKYISGAFCQ
jgi:hypothetical protein